MRRHIPRISTDTDPNDKIQWYIASQEVLEVALTAKDEQDVFRMKDERGR